MKLNSKDSERTLHIERNGDNGFILTERLRYVPFGYAKAKWDDQRVWIQAHELEKALEFIKAEGQ